MKDIIHPQKFLETLFATKHSLKKNDFDVLKGNIEKSDIQTLIIYTCEGTSSLGTEKIMLGLFDYWKGFSYSDWSFMMQHMKDHEIGLINLIIFVGRYLHIDLRPELEHAFSSKKEYVLDYIHDDTPLFFYDKRTRSDMLKDFGLSFDSSFSESRKRLLIEGGKEVKVTEPKKIDISSFPRF